MIRDIFDAQWYLSTYPDVAAAGVDAWEHYQQFGRLEGRLPCAFTAFELDEKLWCGDLPEPDVQALIGEASGTDQNLTRWVLARWLGSYERWQEVADILPPLLSDDAALEIIHHPGPLLLLFSAYVHTNQNSRARELQYHPRWPTSHADNYLACSMLETGTKKLEPLNALFTGQGLLPLQATEPSLDALTTATPAKPKPWQKREKVTVIMPLYNAEATVTTALRSLQRQTWYNLEILVVDDCSDDRSAVMVETLAQQDKRIRVIRHNTNKGAYAARNTALTEARGQFITTHDSDDWSHPQKIEWQVRALKQNKKAMASISHWVRTTPDLQFGRWRMEESWTYRNISSLMFRNTVVKTLGYWDRVSVNGDSEYLERLQCHYGREALVDVLPGVPVAFGRIDRASLTQDSATHLRTQFKGLRKDYMNAARQWHQQTDSLYLAAKPEHRPFAVPLAMCRGTAKAKRHNEQLAVRQSTLFDAAYYLRRYPDVASAGADPVIHYLEHGAAEHRDPSAGFSTSGYAHVQGLTGTQNPLLHCIDHNRESESTWFSLVGDLPANPEAPVIFVCAHNVADTQFGAERSLFDVLQALRRQYRIVLTLPGASSADYVERTRACCHELIILPYRWWHAKRQPDVAITDAFKQLLAQRSAVALYANTLTLWEPLEAAAELGLQRFVHVRELPQHDPDLCIRLGGSAADIRKHVMNHADLCIANSALVARYLNNAAVIVPNAIDVNAFDLAPPLYRQPDVNIMCIGMLSSNLPKKGLHDFVELARRLGEGFQCLLFGPINEHVEALQTQGELPANLSIRGYSETPQKALKKLDVVVNLSHFQESFGRSVLEAMAAARPVVCYDWGALPELVNDKTGRLVPFKDVEAVAEAIREFRENRDLFTQCSKAASRHARQYDFAYFNAKLVSVLDPGKCS